MDEKLSILLKISSDLAKEKDIRALLIKLASLSKVIVEADRCSIYIYDKSCAKLWTIVAQGVDEIRIPKDKGIAGASFTTGKVILNNNVYEDARFDVEIDKKTGYRTKSMLTVPLFDRKREPMGVFQVINKLNQGSFQQDDVQLLEHIALFASSILENALLYDKLKKAHEDVILRLSHATRFKDPETQNHIIRVGRHCATIAKRLNWDPEEVEIIKLAAPMHDIGKMGIPDHVLLKPDKLNEEEWEIMKRHTIFGNQILKNSESYLLQVAATIALDHHEHWDGSGYPNGKREKEISIHGRITALVDVFDALYSNRPYKTGWPLAKIVQHFRDQKEKQFDPEITDVFLASMEEIKLVCEKYHDENSL